MFEDECTNCGTNVEIAYPVYDGTEITCPDCGAVGIASVDEDETGYFTWYINGQPV